MRRAAALLALGVALPACGGEDLGRPAPPEPAKELEPTDWCEVAEEYEFLPIIDFEPKGVTTSLCDVTDPSQEAVSCHWYGGSDMAHVCTDEPRSSIRPTGNMSDPTEVIPGGRCGIAGSGMHVVATRVAACLGSNAKIGWGANWSVDRLPASSSKIGQKACGEPLEGADEPGSSFLDASCWDGISFWVKKNGSTGGAALTITVADPWTAIGKMVPAPTPQNPNATKAYCRTDDAAKDTEKCDAWGAAVSLVDDEWTFVALPWAVLKQKGFGVPSRLEGIDSGNLAAVTILISPGDWDLWIDDVAFFRKVP